MDGCQERARPGCLTWLRRILVSAVVLVALLVALFTAVDRYDGYCAERGVPAYPGARYPSAGSWETVSIRKTRFETADMPEVVVGFFLDSASPPWSVERALFARVAACGKRHTLELRIMAAEGGCYYHMCAAETVDHGCTRVFEQLPGYRKSQLEYYATKEPTEEADGSQTHGTSHSRPDRAGAVRELHECRKALSPAWVLTAASLAEKTGSRLDVTATRGRSKITSVVLSLSR